jgi:hypothetical protein
VRSRLRERDRQIHRALQRRGKHGGIPPSEYRIQQTNRATDNGFEVAFTHGFDDGTVVDARFTMTWDRAKKQTSEPAATAAQDVERESRSIPWGGGS